jgi:hypothetical protein
MRVIRLGRQQEKKTKDQKKKRERGGLLALLPVLSGKSVDMTGFGGCGGGKEEARTDTLVFSKVNCC